MKRRNSPGFFYSSDDELSKTESECAEDGNEVGSSFGVILEQDRFLPIANISRIMKKVIPPEGKLSKEAKECIQECITEFLLFITSEASEKCSMEKRKTITGEDLINSFKTLGFDNYIGPLECFLHNFREANKIHAIAYSAKMEVSNSSPPQQAIGMASQLKAVANELVVQHIQPQQHQHQKLFQPSAPRIVTVVNNSQTIRSPTNNPLNQQQQSISNAAIGQAVPIAAQPVQAIPTSLQPVQVYYDQINKQYYMVALGEDGTHSLVPITLTPTAAAPVATSFVEVSAHEPSLVSKRNTNINNNNIKRSRR